MRGQPSLLTLFIIFLVVTLVFAAVADAQPNTATSIQAINKGKIS